MIKAVIFDWDGLLANTEGLWTAADTKWLAAKGVVYKDELKQKLTGRGQIDCAKIFKEHFKLAETEKQIVAQRLNRVREAYCFVRENILMPFALETLNLICSKKVPMAVASGSAEDILKAAVRSQGVEGYFSNVISSDKVRNGKPAPDIYLYVSELLKKEPNECLVLEDSENGVRAAKAAGMKCVAVPNQYTKHQNFSMADRVISSLAEFSLETF